MLSVKTRSLKTSRRSVERIHAYPVVGPGDTSCEVPQLNSHNDELPLLEKNKPITEEEDDLVKAEKREMKEIVEHFGYLERKMDKNQQSKIVKDIFGLIPRGVYNAMYNLGNILLTALGFLILGRNKETEMSASYTQYLMLYSLLWLCYVTSAESFLTIVASQVFASGSSPASAKKYFSQTILMYLLFIGLLYVPFIIFIPEIFGLVGMSTSLTVPFRTICLKMLGADFLEGFSFIMQGYCNAQLIEDLFTHLTWIVMVPIFCLILFCEFYLEMGFEAFIILININKVAYFIAVLIVYRVKTIPESRGLCSIKHLFTDLWQFIKGSLSVWLSALFEFFSADIPTFFVSLGGDPSQIASTGAILNINSFIYRMSLGFLLIGRNRVNYLLGAGLRTAAKKAFLMALVSEGLMTLVVSLLFFFFREQVAAQYGGNDPGIMEYLPKLIAIYSGFMLLDCHYSLVVAISRSTNHVVFSTVVFGFFAVVVNSTVSLVLSVWIKADCVVIFSAIMTCWCLSILIVFFKLVAMDWNKAVLLLSELD